MNGDICVVIEHLRDQVADISFVMLAAARALAQASGGGVKAVLLGYNAQNLAKNLSADQVISCDHPGLAEFRPEAYERVLAKVIQDHEPRIVLLGDTSMGAEVAGRLSAGLELPLVSYCMSLHAEAGTVKYRSRICGGKIMVEGTLPGPTALVAMIPGDYSPEDGQSTVPPEMLDLEAPPLENLRVTLEGYIEPDASDVDISKEPILIAVGRGIQTQDNIELAQELAEALGGTVCASRPVVDQGWLPTTRLVGKSGKHVKPQVYLALGISGAPEHAEGITGSEVIIAVNTDPGAPIFDVARYGANIDIFELVPTLSHRILEAQSA